jgi:hypothetical protein
VLRCAADAAYLSTGRATFAVPSTTASAPSGVHAMLLAPAPAGAAVMEDMRAMHFAKHAEKEKGEEEMVEEVKEEVKEEAEEAAVHVVPMSIVSTARYSAAPASAAAAASAEAATEVAAPPELADRRLSEEVTPLNCGGDDMPPCQTEEEKKKEEKVQEGEANFAMLVAFVGCVAIVRAANKYARNPA